MAMGRRLTGRDEISEFTHRVLPGAMRHSTATYQIVHILFIRPDIAVVNVLQQPVTLDRRPIDTQPQGSPVYVLARNHGAWQIAAGQNTRITGGDPPSASRSNAPDAGPSPAT